MGSVSYTITENTLNNLASTYAKHTVTASADDVTATNSSFIITQKLTDKYNISTDGRVGIYDYVFGKWYNGTTELTYRWRNAFWIPTLTGCSPNTEYSYEATTSIVTASLFNSSNPNDLTVPITFKAYYERYSTVDNDENFVGSYTAGTNDSSSTSFVRTFDEMINVTLNAPPTFTVSYTPPTNVYAGITDLTITLSDLSAQYGGSITSAVLTVGNQTATRTTDGDLTITLDTAGTFTPTVTVTDSRGQTSTLALYDITVTEAATAKVKDNGTWCDGVIYVKVNGAWVVADSMYIKSNGTWYLT